MSLDEDKFQECGAEVRLEKPFEVDDLRGIVQRYVPLVQENKVAPFLKFSSSITQEFKEEVKQQAAAPQAPAVAPEKQEEALPKQKPHVVAAAPEAPAASELGKSDSGSWSMEDFDKLASLDTEDLSGTQSGLFQSAESDPWSAQNLDEFKVDLQEVDEEEFVITTLEDSPTGSPASLEFTRLEETPEELPTEEGEDLQLSEDWSKIPLPPTQEASVLNPSVKKMVDEYLERAFRSELEARLEKALREMLPELASRVIKEEIRRLTRDLD